MRFISLCFAVLSSSSAIQVNSLDQDITAVRDSLSTMQPFVHVDLQLTPDEQAALAKLVVRQDGDINNFADPDRLATQVTTFLHAIGNIDPVVINKVCQLIVRCVKSTTRGYSAEAAWVTVRSFIPTAAFDLPRWHIDGYYFDLSGEVQSKMVVTLFGSPTLFNQLPNTKRDAFMALLSQDDRQGLAQLVDSAQTTNGSIGHGTIFCSGDKNMAAVHSEPPIKTARLFLSILPGSRAQILALQQRWAK